MLQQHCRSGSSGCTLHSLRHSSLCRPLATSPLLSQLPLSPLLSPTVLCHKHSGTTADNTNHASAHTVLLLLLVAAVGLRRTERIATSISRTTIALHPLP